MHTLEICEVALLVEAGLVEAERVDDIDLLLRRVLDTLLGLLSRGIAASVYIRLGCCVYGKDWRRGRTEGLASNSDLLAVGLVDDTVDLLEVVRVRDHLVAGEDVLHRRG